jgi:thiol-disulfide isomerase/thioredoxin
MIRSIRLALLSSCALSLVASFAVRQSAALNKSQVPSPVSQVKEKGLGTWDLELGTSQQKSSAPAVREIDVAGLKKLLARDGKIKRPLLINFWATWCEPCRAEFPDLVKIDNEYRKRGLDFIAVSIDDVSEIQTTVPGFLKEMRATMPAYLLNTLEPEAAIAFVDPQWSGSLPATFLYDAQGKVVFRHLGRIKPDELRAVIKTVISDK